LSGNSPKSLFLYLKTEYGFAPALKGGHILKIWNKSKIFAPFRAGKQKFGIIKV
jgi:hypothetical protein